VGLPPGERKRLPFGHEVPPAYGALARLPDRVVYDGLNGPEAIALGMYYAIFHRKAVPIGYSGFSPPAAGYVTQRLFRFPEDDALVLLDALGIRHVLWHFATPAAADAFLAGPTPPSLSVAGRFGGDVLFTLGEAPVLSPVAAAIHALARAGWRLTASAGGDRLPALVDGDPRSAWAALVDGGRTPWVLVDLGRPERVAGVRCTPTRADALAVPLALVELSEDGEHWERVPRRFVPDSLATLIEHPARLASYEARFPTRRVRSANGWAAWTSSSAADASGWEARTARDSGAASSTAIAGSCRWTPICRTSRATSRHSSPPARRPTSSSGCATCTA